MWLLKEQNSSIHVDMKISPKYMVKVQSCVYSMLQYAGENIHSHLHVY